MRDATRKIALGVAVCAGVILMTGNVSAKEKRIALKLGGQYCGFYLDDVKKALKGVPGVKKVSFNSTQDKVFISGSKLNPTDLISAVDKVKGSSWYCTAETE
ncbi:MAG: heavy-metal-associated domain-containing protein [Leptospirales bacterium]